MKVQKITYENGETIYFEAEGPIEHEEGYKLAAKAATDIKFEDVIDRARRLAETAVRKFKQISVRPDEMELEFGITLNSELGGFLAKCSGESHIKCKMLWKTGDENGK